MSGMTLAIEPMVNALGEDVRVLSNDWTVVTTSGSLSAHYENTMRSPTTDGYPDHSGLMGCDRMIGKGSIVRSIAGG
jgi:hypothetical protein